MARYKMTKRHSRKNFRKGLKTRKVNVAPPIMRGGIRL